MKGYQSSLTNLMYSMDLQPRFFFKLFKSKKGPSNLRPGAIPPNEVKKMIKEFGVHKKINIRRIEYDGSPEEKPITVQIVHIRDDYFTAKVVNVERSIKQDINDKLVYIKGGGGTIDFYYEDGDIYSIEEDIDEVVIRKMDDETLLSILQALDIDESILVSYYDNVKGGVINGSGKLVAKDLENRSFKVELTLINDIELEKPKYLTFDMDKDKVLDLEVVI